MCGPKPQTSECASFLSIAILLSECLDIAHHSTGLAACLPFASSSHAAHRYRRMSQPANCSPSKQGRHLTCISVLRLQAATRRLEHAVAVCSTSGEPSEVRPLPLRTSKRSWLFSPHLSYLGFLLRCETACGE